MLTELKKIPHGKKNLKKEISKYVKIKPTNINEIEGVTGALLRAEQSISRGNLAEAIEEISSVPLEERGPLEAWLGKKRWLDRMLILRLEIFLQELLRHYNKKIDKNINFNIFNGLCQHFGHVAF